MNKYNKIITKELNKLLPYHLLGVIFHAIVIYMAFKIPECIGNILDMLRVENIDKVQIINEAYKLIFYSSFIFVPRTIARTCYHTKSRESEVYLRKKVIEHLQKVNPEYFEKENKGTFLAYLSKELLAIRRILGSFWFYLSKMLITPIMGLILIWNQFNKEIALYIIPIFPIAIIVMYYQYKKLRKQIEESRKAYIELSKNIEQNTEGFLLIKSYNRQEEQSQKFKKINQKMYEADYKIGVAQNRIKDAINILYGLCYIIGFGTGIIYIQKNAITVGELTTFIGYIGLLLENFISSIERFFARVPYFKQSINRFNYFLNLEEYPDKGEELEDIELIEIKHLSYWYNDNKKPALSDINMTIKKGEKIGIIGEVGSGKTTLMNIMTGFYEIPDGMISINNKDINNYKKSSIFEKYNYAIQKNIILDDTIKSNIDIVEDLDDDEIEEFIKKAELQEDIAKLKHKEETLVGEKGIKLSGGQKQRISIARNLGKIRNVNIFDDTLSALDSNTEKKIMDTLFKEVKDNTLIVVSNKISNIKNLDKIYILSNGTIQDYGTHEELIQRNEFYKELENLERREEANEEYSKEKC